MKQLLTTFMICLACLPGLAQKVTNISGQVTDAKGQPIIGANVYLDGVYDGASTNLEGQFAFTTSQQDTLTIMASFMGYKTHQQAIVLGQQPQVILSITLKEVINKIDGVVITAGAFEASDERKAVQLKPMDIVTTAGALGDVFGAMTTLPGTTTVGESGRLFVRGGEGREAQTFIDGMLVPRPFEATVNNVPTRGRYSPMLFKGTMFSTGGYSAEYGQALSSALVMTSKDEPEQTQTDIAVMAVGAGVERQVKKATESWSIAANYQNLAPLFNLVQQDFDWGHAPESYNGHLVWRKKLANGGRLKTMVFYDHDNFELTQEDIRRETGHVKVNLANHNAYANTSYRQVIGNQWSVKAGVSAAYDKQAIDLDLDNLREQQYDLHAKAVLNYDGSERLSFRFGSEVLMRDFEQLYADASLAETFDLSYTNTLSAGFAEADVYLSNKLVLRGGLRGEHASVINKAMLSPRLSMAWKTAENTQLSVAWGMFGQLPEHGVYRVTRNLTFERAQHYIINYQVQKNKRTFRAEAYYKKYTDLVQFNSDDPFALRWANNNGHGYAKGIDLWWRDRKTIKNGDYWVSYSFLDSRRHYRDFPAEAVPTFVARHSLSIVYKHFVPGIKSQVGFAWNVASGRPYENPNTEGFNNERTMAYNALNLNMAYLYRQHIIVYASVSNVLGRNHVFNYRYANQPDATGIFAEQPIGQAARRFAFVGLFITLSDSKNTNQLNNL